MSHFSVAVFCHNIDEVAELLEPFSENLTVQPPYGEFVEDEECEYDETAKAKGYWCNPNAKWDYWEIGGGWRGLLKLLPGKTGYNISNGRCDTALVADCEFSPSEGEIHRAARMWEVLVEGDAPHEGEEFFNPWTPEYYLKRYGERKPSSVETRRSAPMPSSRRKVNGMSRGAWAGSEWTTRPTRASPATR